MEQNDKPYWKETFECYLVTLIILFVFFGVIIMSGQLTGTDWIAYLKDLSQGIGKDMLNNQ